MRTFLHAVKFGTRTEQVRIGRRAVEVLKSPESLSLTNNFAETLAFIYTARRMLYSRRGSPPRVSWRIDFEPIKMIGPAASLVLAAELDRWTFLRGRPPLPLVETWQPFVKAAFHDLGLLPLLGLPQLVRPAEGDQPALKFLPFRRGLLTKGQDANELREEMERLAGRRLSAPHALYGALCEAMTNAIHHAYRLSDAAWPAPYVRCWWANGAFNQDTKTLHFFVYDQGVGIPRTLPRSTFWEQILALRLEMSDAALIDAAVQIRRSSVPTPGRGRGLDEIVSYLDAEGRGRLRIVSGEGEVCYMPNGQRTKRTLPAKLIGTLVEWQILCDE
jgi:hypothetical protein